MIILKNHVLLGILFTGLMTDLLSAHQASAAESTLPLLIQCSFGTCTVEIFSENSLTLTCEGKAMYRGPYSLNTDFRTIQIECPTAEGPRIMTQSLPTPQFSSKATLSFSGRQVEGVCLATP